MTIRQLQTGILAVNTYIVPCSAEPSCTRVFIVDPGGNADKIVQAVGTDDVAGIVLTHGHFDHVGAVPELKKRYGVPLCIHEADLCYTGKAAAETHQLDFSRVGMFFSSDDPCASLADFPEADIVFRMNAEQERLPLDFAPEWSVLHTGGHSPGSVCLYHEDGCLLSGDTLFASGIGRTDLHGGNFEELMRSLSRIFKLPDATRVYPGHGLPTTIGREKRGMGY